MTLWNKVTDSNTKESSSVAKDGGIDAIPENSWPPPGLEFEDIEGVRPTTAKKLKEAGIVSVMDLVVTSAHELAVDINALKESAAAFIMAAQKILRDSRIIEKEFHTADFAMEKRRSMLRSPTGSRALDEPLLGGNPSGN